MDTNVLRQLLGLTGQQSELMKVIYILQSEQKKVSPKNILQRYAEEYKVKLQKPNLFNVLRKLIDMQIIEKNDGTYVINFEGLSGRLNQERINLNKRVSQIEETLPKMEEIFRKIPEQSLSTFVKFLELQTYKEKLFELLKTARIYYAYSRFPGISYTHLLSKTIDSEKHHSLLKERCLLKKELEIWYLTHLDMTRPFKQAMLVFNDKKRARDECMVVINELVNMIKNSPMLKVFCFTNAYGLDITLPVSVEPSHLFVGIRGNDAEQLGVIYIKSSETGKRARDTFVSLCNSSTLITSKNIERFVKKMNADVDMISKNYKKMTDAK